MILCRTVSQNQISQRGVEKKPFVSDKSICCYFVFPVVRSATTMKAKTKRSDAAVAVRCVTVWSIFIRMRVRLHCSIHWLVQIKQNLFIYVCA